MLILISYLAIVAILFFLNGYFFPVEVSSIIILTTFIIIYYKYRVKEIGALFFLLYIAYLIPFIHIPPYIFFDYSSSPLLLWGLAVRPYMVEREVINLTAMLGAVGALGLSASALVGKKKLNFILNQSTHTKTISILSFVFWMFLGVAISKLSAPNENIFEAGYGDVESVADKINLGSAWLVSYIMLSFLVVDALLEKNEKIRKIKIPMIFLMLIYVAFFLQFMRGDRAVIPWIFSLLIFYFIWNPNSLRIKLEGRQKLFLMLMVIILMIISSFIGILRNSLVDGNFSTIITLIFDMYESGNFDLSNALHGTWSAVLLTPLSVAGDYVHGLLDFKLGSDYFNLFLSLPPGALADAIGYTRPWGSNSGPPFEMRYGQGGTHATVLPFMNFGIIGVFIFALLIGRFYISVEHFSRKNTTTINLSLLVSIALSTPHFLWYGEKNGVNAIIGWGFFAIIYKLLTMPFFAKNSWNSTGRNSINTF